MSAVALAITPFKIDVTPPVGDYLCGGLWDRSTGVETPLHLRGLVLHWGEARYVLAVVDFCYLCGRSQQRLVEALARGAQTPVGHVSLHSNHAHDAPLMDEEAHHLLQTLAPEWVFHNESYFGEVLARVNDEVRQACAAVRRPITGIAFASAAVQEFASSRRVLDENHKAQKRYSVCQVPEVRQKPEGFIDPLLDQVVLCGPDGKAVTCLSFYACHPQVSDGRGLISGDTIAVATELFEKQNPGVFPLYFTGCAGDVTAGKYTTTQRHRNRLVFGIRLYDGMQEAFDIASHRVRPVHSLGWGDETFEVPLAPIVESAGHYREMMTSTAPTLHRSRRYLAAMKLLRLEQGLNRYPYRISRLRINDVNVLMLPSEMCVEYQLFAKSRCNGYLAVTAYGDSFLKYVATDEAFDQGGYEVEPLWTEVGKGIEGVLKEGIVRMLQRTI